MPPSHPGPSALAVAAAVREQRTQAAVSESVASQAALDRATAQREAMHARHRRNRVERASAP